MREEFAPRGLGLSRWLRRVGEVLMASAVRWRSQNDHRDSETMCTDAAATIFVPTMCFEHEIVGLRLKKAHERLQGGRAWCVEVHTVTNGTLSLVELRQHCQARRDPVLSSVHNRGYNGMSSRGEYLWYLGCV